MKENNWPKSTEKKKEEIEKHKSKHWLIKIEVIVNIGRIKLE